MVRRPALRLPAGHHHDGEGPHVVVRADGRDDRLRPRHRAVPRGPQLVRRTASRSAGTRSPRPSRSPTSRCSRTRASSRTCARTRPHLRAMLDSLRDIPIVGDVRGAGYFHAIELVKDQRDEGDASTDEEAETLLRGFLSRRAVPARADLPRRRPRRPGDPARAAADRRARAVRGDRRRAAAGARRGLAPDGTSHRPRSRRCSPSATSSRDLDVRLLAGRGGPRRARCAGCTSPSSPDPTPWLSGGELLLTTGHGSSTRRGASASSSRGSPTTGSPGSGFGTGFAHADGARGARRGGRRARLPARSRCPTRCRSSRVTEQAFTRLVNEQYALLQRVDRRARAAASGSCSRERGLDGVVGALAALIGGAGARLRRPRRARRRSARSAARSTPTRSPRSATSCASARAAATRRGFVPGARRPRRRARSRCRCGAARRRPTAALPAGVARRGQGRRRPDRVRPPDPAPGRHGRRARAAAPPRRRRHRAPAGRRRARRGRRRRARRRRARAPARAVRARRPRRRRSSSRRRERVARRRRGGARRARCATRRVSGLVAGTGRFVVRAAAPGDGATTSCSSSPSASRARVAEQTGAERSRAGAGRAVAAGRAARELPRGALRARGARADRRATAATATATGAARAPELATYRDLGSFQLLLSLQDDDALRLFCDSILAPIEDGEGALRRRADALARGVHRVQRPVGGGRAAALLPPPHAALPDPHGRGAHRPRPDSARDRIDFWLALRGRELVQPTASRPETRASTVKVGVPTEIKTDEYRVALTPAGVRELAEHGHEVVVQAGRGRGLGDRRRRLRGAGRARSCPTPTRCSPRRT